MPRGKVDGQPAYVLHSYPFRETSLIVEVFSRDYGRVPLLARGARRPRSAIRGLLMAFQPLELGWSGKGEVLTLMKAEWQGGMPLLAGQTLFCGYYLNELLLNLLPREDSHPQLFACYGRILSQLADDPAGVRREADLRSFEKALLQELGYGLTLDFDRDGAAIEPDVDYTYEIEHGASRLPIKHEGIKASVGQTWISGLSLLDLAAEDFSRARSRSETKQLMRTLMNHYLSGSELKTRRIFKELQDICP